MSAAAMAAGRSASPAAVALTSAARRSAWLRVRLATTMLAAPLRAAAAAASALIEPAPTISTSRPASASAPGPLPRLAAASSTATVSRLRPAWSIPVSARARLPVRSASRPSSLRTRPTVPCSPANRSAERTWPRICPSPTTIESSPQVTAIRWLTARSS